MDLRMMVLLQVQFCKINKKVSKSCKRHLPLTEPTDDHQHWICLSSSSMEKPCHSLCKFGKLWAWEKFCLCRKGRQRRYDVQRCHITLFFKSVSEQQQEIKYKVWPRGKVNKAARRNSHQDPKWWIGPRLHVGIGRGPACPLMLLQLLMTD